jgi:hypothetical protein
MFLAVSKGRSSRANELMPIDKSWPLIAAADLIAIAFIAVCAPAFALPMETKPRIGNQSGSRASAV